MIGAFERNARPWAVAGIPEGTSFTQLDEDWDHFEPYLQAALRRVPALETTGIRQFFNGPESFTPDTRHVTGESAEVRGLFVAAGFNSTGIMCSAGVGKTLAEWIVDGRPSLDLFDVDVQRFEPWQASRGFLRARTGESVGAQFDMHWPYRQHETGRDAKRSPFHDRFARRGACFGVVAGWERPLWFAHTGDTPEHTYRFGPQAWWRRAADEGRATRDAVALYEQTPFAKFVLEGPDAQPFLQRLCANDVAVPQGKVVYTQLLNRWGGIESDLTVTRSAEDRYWIVTGAGVRRRDLAWIERQLPHDGGVSITDVSSAYAVLGVMGPRARELLASLTDADLSNERFPFATAQTIDIGHARVTALRMSFVGELGWELYIPSVVSHK